MPKEARPGRPWSARDDGRLKALYGATPSIPTQVIAQELRRPYAEVRDRARALRLRRPRRKKSEMPSRVAGGVAEGAVADEALRARCRQLARDLGPAGRATPWELRGAGWSGPYLGDLLTRGRRWFRVDAAEVVLTPEGAAELLGGAAA